MYSNLALDTYCETGIYVSQFIKYVYNIVINTVISKAGQVNDIF